MNRINNSTLFVILFSSMTVILSEHKVQTEKSSKSIELVAKNLNSPRLTRITFGITFYEEDEV